MLHPVSLEHHQFHSVPSLIFPASQSDRLSFRRGVASQGHLIWSSSRSKFLPSDSVLTDGMNVSLCLPSPAVLFSSGASLAWRLSVRLLMVKAGLVASFSLSSFMNDPPPSLFTPVVRPQWSVRGPCLAAVPMATPQTPSLATRRADFSTAARLTLKAKSHRVNFRLNISKIPACVGQIGNLSGQQTPNYTCEMSADYMVLFRRCWDSKICIFFM